MNKLTIVAAICMLLNANIYAQTEKGKMMFGGSVTFSTDNNNDNTSIIKNSNFSINPLIGFFIADNFSIGSSLTFIASKAEQTLNPANGGGKIKSISKYYGIAPFGRYYFNIGERFKFFGQFNLFYAFGDVNYSNYLVSGGKTIPYDSHQYGAGLSPGLTFFPTAKLGIEFFFDGLSYRESRNEDGMGSIQKTSTFNFGFSTFNPSLGLNYHF